MFSKRLRNSILKYIVGLIAIIGILYLVFTHLSVVIPVVIAGVILLFIATKISNDLDRKHDSAAIKSWSEQTCPCITENMIANNLIPFVRNINEIDSNRNMHFDSSSIPYGRTNAFLNYFDKTIDIEEPIYYSPIRSKTKLELRECGALLTLGGIYICKQINVTDSNGNYKCNQYNLSFNGMWKINRDGSSIVVKYKNLDKIVLNQENTTIPLDFIYNLCQMIIETKISLAITKGYVFSEEQSLNFDQKIDGKFRRTMKNEFDRGIFESGGVMGSMPNMQEQYNQVKYNWDGARGNGYGAEYANNVKDRAFGRNVEYTASKLDENGRQVKNGADRTVNGINIQTKYYKTASESIGAAFEHKQAQYLNLDGSMMPIEVPRDQYQEALTQMQKRIDSGQVPGAKPGDNPRKYVRKGILTYAQSFNVCKSGSVESLTFDAINGAICCSSAGGITIAFVFATQIWNGVPPKDAAKAALIAGGRVIGKGTVVYMVTMQLSRKEVINPFVKEFTKDGKYYKGFGGIKNPLYTIGDSLAQKIASSDFAASSIGQTLKLTELTGRTLISGSVLVILTFGPDICRALVGRISIKQLIKNTTIGAAGLAGGAIGQILIPIPIVGAMLGGAAATVIAKRTMDNFIEDDAEEMYQILKEEFLDIVMLSNLSKQEFDQVIDLTFGDKKLPKLLRDMYAYGDSREFARNYLVSGAVIEVMSKRRKITDDIMDNGYLALAG